MGFLRCAVYAAVIGCLSFLLGRIIPGSWFQPDQFPFRCMRWEQGGSFYNRVFKIRRWQAKVPDMSKILPGMMPAKKITSDFQGNLPRMIVETCIAEWIHVLLCLLSFPCLWLWPGAGGAVFMALYILIGNLPFILIQRYNRPRLVSLQNRMMRNRSRKESDTNGYTYLKLQHGAGA